MATLRPTNRRGVVEAGMSITNGDVAKRAYELAESARGLQRMAALCVSVAAATTSTTSRAKAALDNVPHAGLRLAAQLMLADLAGQPDASEPAAGPVRLAAR
jgi:hypothetical protein